MKTLMRLVLKLLSKEKELSIRQISLRIRTHRAVALRSLEFLKRIKLPSNPIASNIAPIGLPMFSFKFPIAFPVKTGDKKNNPASKLATVTTAILADPLET